MKIPIYAFRRLSDSIYDTAEILTPLYKRYYGWQHLMRRIKITSPGGIFNATMDDIMNGVQTYRNPRLVNVFDKLHLIENFGTGIPRTLQSYEGCEVKPEFKASENFFIVTLPNVNYSQNESINESINDLGLGILRIIKENPGINAPSITSLLSEKDHAITLSRVKIEIGRNLEGYIEHIGSNKTGGYYLKKKE